MKCQFNNLGIVIAAGGSGLRYGQNNKLLEILGGVPVFIHAVKAFSGCCPAHNFILTVPPGAVEIFDEMLQRYAPKTAVNIRAGGTVRGDSVWNGLQGLQSDAEYVAVHDAARPLADANLLAACYQAAVEFGAAAPGKPVTDTLKRCDAAGIVMETVPRAMLWRIETPQVFRTALLQKAYRLARECGGDFTDDAGVLEASGGTVKVVNNREDNTKITTPADLPILSYRLASRQA